MVRFFLNVNDQCHVLTHLPTSEFYSGVLEIIISVMIMNLSRESAASVRKKKTRGSIVP